MYICIYFDMSLLDALGLWPYGNMYRRLHAVATAQWHYVVFLRSLQYRKFPVQTILDPLWLKSENLIIFLRHPVTFTQCIKYEGILRLWTISTLLPCKWERACDRLLLGITLAFYTQVKAMQTRRRCHANPALHSSLFLIGSSPPSRKFHTAQMEDIFTYARLY